MFRCLQKLRYPVSYVPTIPVEENLEDGSIVQRFESSVRKMPSPENFQLKNLLRAGVPIKEVNGLVFDSGYADFSNETQSIETQSTETKSTETKSTETKSTETIKE